MAVFKGGELIHRLFLLILIGSLIGLVNRCVWKQ